MTTKPMTTDLTALAAAGITTLLQARVFAHIGRCGLSGTTISRMYPAIGIPIESIRSAVDRLEDLKLISRYGRENRQGGARLWVCTRHGWGVLTTPASADLFPDALGKII